MTLKAHVASITRNTMLIRDQELYKLLKDADVHYDMADLNMLDQYLSFSVNKESNTINFDNFLFSLMLLLVVTAVLTTLHHHQL